MGRPPDTARGAALFACEMRTLAVTVLYVAYLALWAFGPRYL